MWTSDEREREKRRVESGLDVLVVSDAVREFILSSFLPGDPESSLRNDDLLLEGGIIDSASVLMLVFFLEDHFDVAVQIEQFVGADLVEIAFEIVGEISFEFFAIHDGAPFL